MDIAKIRKKRRKTKAESQEVTSEYQNHGETGQTGAQQQEKPSEKHDTQATRESEKAVTHDEKGKEQKVEVQQLKKEEVKEETTYEVIEIFTFSLLKEEFAFKISQLEEIMRPQKITVVPKLPKYVLGITSLRGKVIPVLDLKLKLSLTDKSSDINTKGKILIIKGTKGPIGAIIDKVIGVVRVGKNEIIPPPSHLTEAELKFIEGIAVVDKRFISIVNLEEAISINV